jgi:O-antigen ligase
MNAFGSSGPSPILVGRPQALDHAVPNRAVWQFVALSSLGVFLLSFGARPLIATSLLLIGATCGFLSRKFVSAPPSIWILVFAVATVSLIFAELRTGGIGRTPLVTAVLALAGVLAGVPRQVSLQTFRIAALLIAFTHIPIGLINRDSSDLGAVGLTSHKNLFGFACAFAVAVLFPWFLESPRGRLRKFLFATLAFAYLGTYISASSGAIIVAVFVGVWSLAVDRGYRLAPLAFLTLAIPLGIQSIDAGVGLSYIGEDATLTGRSVIWRTILTHADQYVIVGDGFGTQWSGSPLNGEERPPLAMTSEVWQEVGARVSSSHNGYIELGISLGIPIAIVMTSYFLYRWILVHRQHAEIARLISPLFAMVALSMTVESFLTVPLVLLTGSYLLLNRQLTPDRSARHAG